MNNLFVAISDIHFNIKNLEVSMLVLRQALEKARELNVPLFVLGDLNDTKAIMRSEWVSSIIKLFKEFKSVKIHVVIGNHDLNNKNSTGHSLEFLEDYDNVLIYNNEQDILINNTLFFAIPYKSKKEDFISAVEKAKSFGAKNILCHQGFLGSFMGDYAVDESSVDPKILESFDIVLSGHYHKHQRVEKNIVYLGSPYTINFGESGESKFFWQVFSVDGKIEISPIMTKARKHIQEVFDEYIPEDHKSQASSEDLIKVVLKGPREFCLKNHSRVLSKIFNGNKNITVIPDIQAKSKKRINIEDVVSPFKVINDFLENASTHFDKAILINHLHSIIGDYLNNISKTIRNDIKILSASARNFLSYSELDYDYEPRGLTLVEGFDEDYSISSGAGKSSFLDVVCYGLFGETSKNLKSDEVINRQEGKNLSTKILVSTERGKLLVCRYRKHKDFENDLFYTYDLTCSPDNLIRGKDLKETQKLLETELGLDYDMFLRSSYFSQFGAIDRFLSASDTEKKKIISKICNTEIYDEIVVFIKNSIKQLTEELSSINLKMVAKVSEVNMLQGNVSKFQSQMEEFETSKQNELVRIKLSIDSFEQDKANKIQIIQKEIEAFDSKKQIDILDLESKQFDFENQRNVRIKNAEINKGLFEDAENKRREELLKLASSKENEAIQLQQRVVETINDFSKDKEKIKSKIEIVKNLNNELIKINVQTDGNNKQIKKLESEIAQAKNKMSEVSCPYCFGPISGESIEKKVKDLNYQIRQLEITNDSLEQGKIQIEQSVKILPNLEAQLLEIQSKEVQQREIIKASEYAKERISLLNSEVLSLRNSYNDWKGPANPYEDQIKIILLENNPFDREIELKKKEQNPFIQKLEFQKNEQNPFLKQYDDKLKTKNHFVDLFQAEAEKLNSHSSRLQEIMNEEGQAKERLAMSEFWKDAIGIYIKSYLTDSFVEQINAMTNEILIEMFDGILSINIDSTTEDKKQTKEKISVSIFNKNEECSYNSLSGGERCRICFALNLAVAKVTGKNFGFLMMDEVLNGLDDVGKNQVMKILKGLESIYPTVFVIDHATEFKAMFSNSILIKKANGISKIS